MPIKINNVSLDPAFAMKRRMASRLQMEPVIAGERLRLRQSRTLTDDQVAANVQWLAELERGGVISIEKDGSIPLDVLLPTPPPPPAPVPEPKKEEFVLPPESPPSPPAPPESAPLASSSETPSTAAVTQPLPNMGHRKGDKKQGR